MDYPVAVIGGILLADGWHEVVPGSFTLDQDPSFSLPTGEQVTPAGGWWLRFTEAATGKIYAAPLSRIEGIRANAA